MSRFFFITKLLCLIILFPVLKTQAQDEQSLIKQTPKSTKYIEANLHSGKLINNFAKWDSFPDRRPLMLMEVQVGKQSVGEKKWQQYYSYPQVGVSLIGGYLGNNSKFGQTIGIVPNITFVANKNKDWSFCLKLGMGFAYFNKPYHAVTNKANVLIGSHITNMSIGQMYFIYKLNEHIDANMGLSVIHASNGHYQLPNIGANMVAGSMGVKYYIKARPQEYYVSQVPLKHSKKTTHIGFSLGGGVHEFGKGRNPIFRGKYPVADACIYLKRKAGVLGSVHIGGGYRYYTAYHKSIISDTTFTENVKLKSSVFTIFAAYEFEMGQMSFLAQGGINLYNPFWQRYSELIEKEYSNYQKLKGLISTRLGLQYYLLDKQKFEHNIYLGLYIKANMGGADFASFNAGFVF